MKYKIIKSEHKNIFIIKKWKKKDNNVYVMNAK